MFFPFFIKLLWVQKKEEDKAEEEKEVQGKRERKTGRKERMEGLLQLPQVHPVGVVHARNHLPHTLQFGSRRE